MLEVRATPAVRGLVRFDLEGAEQGRATVVEMSEEPLYRKLGDLLRPILDPLTHLRNKRSLVKFEQLVERTGVEPAKCRSVRISGVVDAPAG